MHRSQSPRRLTLMGVLVALSFILSYLESLIPPFTGIPGVKPGLANITVMYAIYAIGWKEALILGIVRTVLSGLTFSGMFSMMYSLAGSLLSIAVMLMLKKASRFSLVAVSIAGGVAHNIGQILVAIAVTGTAVLYYLPILIISGLLAGCLVGIISGALTRRLSHILDQSL